MRANGRYWILGKEYGHVTSVERSTEYFLVQEDIFIRRPAPLNVARSKGGIPMYVCQACGCWQAVILCTTISPSCR